MYKNNNSDQLEIGQIILTHLKKILDLSSHELRSSERILLLADQKQIIESEDTRVSYIQAIENLSYVLIPYFDKKMQEVFDDKIIYLNGFGFEIQKKIDDKEFKERLSEKQGDEKRDLIIMWQIRQAKKMFIELNFLLRRINYLKSAVFGEGDSDTEVEEE